MNNDRIRRVLREMEQAGIPQMIVSDPVAIYYLTGRKIFSGERLLALYLQVNGGHKLVINELFPQSAEPDGQLELVWYSDTQDGVELLHQFADKASPMGIDKNWPARFLLRLQELGGGSAYVNGSPIIDRVRMIKDQEEQEKMRRSSQINDQVMAELLTWVGKGLTEEEMAEKAKAIYRAHGCEGLSFPPIVSYGRGAAEPHHEPGDARAKRGDCVLLDIGGMKDGYASDMTRTVFLGRCPPASGRSMRSSGRPANGASMRPDPATGCAMWTWPPAGTLKSGVTAPTLPTARATPSAWRTTSTAMCPPSTRR